MNAAAFLLVSPDLADHDHLFRSVALEERRGSPGKDDPTIGSPPIPTIVEFPSLSCVSSCPIQYVSVPERETSPIEPSRKISAE